MRCTEKSSRRIYEPDDNIGIAWECSLIFNFFAG